MTEATDQEIRAVVEQWARARGWWWDHGESAAARTGYDDRPHLAPERWTVWHGGEQVRVRWSVGIHDVKNESRLWDVSPHAALVWALTLETRPLRDGTRCRRCRGRGTWGEWQQCRTVGTEAAQEQWTRNELAWYAEEGWDAVAWSDGGFGLAVAVIVVASRTIPCPDCDCTGLADLTDEYAQHVLDAQPRPGANGIRFITYADTSSVVLRYRVDGADEDSIEALHVLADQLQAAGDPLGLDIAHLLAGESGRAEVGADRLIWRTEQHRHSRSNTSAQVTALSHEP